MNILGLWDGHDSGAALLVDGRLAAAMNEERFTRRKLEIVFPALAIHACLEYASLQPADIDVVAISTSDPSKTLGRWAPSLKERFYAERRRKTWPGPFPVARKRAKYWLTERPTAAIWRALSRVWIRRRLDSLGLARAELALYDHHHCHATAGYFSGFDRSVVLTIDGVGDGLSGSVSTLTEGRLTRIASTPATASAGVFFELVTNLLNMRELEDEGKVMALADYATPVPDRDNPMLDMIGVEGLSIRTAVPAHALWGRLKRVLWRSANEQFAWMAQRAIERVVTELTANAVAATGLRDVVLAGGVASNIKASRRVRMSQDIDDVYVFPHMGDGGLALGAAVAAAVERDRPPCGTLDDLGLGPEYSEESIAGVLDARGVPSSTVPDPAAHAADRIALGEIVLWFQGRMELGPRALGHRSILARPDSTAIRDRLNLVLKRRSWYQPFCPSILERDARQVLNDWKGRPNRHMTMAYVVAAEWRDRLAGVIGPDGSCRPQMVPESAGDPFARLLGEVRTRIGLGAVLNTSFNVHGEPVVCNPAEALDVFLRTGADCLVIGHSVVRRRS